MPTVTETLDRAEGALDAVIDTVKDRLQALPVEAKEAASEARDDSKALAAKASYLLRRQAAAWVGITDATLAAWTKRSDELQVESKKNAAKLVDDTKGRVTQVSGRFAQAGEDFERAVGTAGRSVLANMDARYNDAVYAFNELADRGEKIITQFRHQRPVKVTTPAKTGTTSAPTRKAPAAKTQATSTAKSAGRATKSTAKSTAGAAKSTAKSTARTATSTAKSTARAAKSSVKKTTAASDKA